MVVQTLYRACCGHVHLNRSCSEVASTLGCIKIMTQFGAAATPAYCRVETVHVLDLQIAIARFLSTGNTYVVLIVFLSKIITACAEYHYITS